MKQEIPTLGTLIEHLQTLDPTLTPLVLSTCSCCTEEVRVERGKTIKVEGDRLILGDYE